MTTQIALTLAIIAGALVIIGTEKLRVDVVGLIILLTVALTGLVGPEDVFAGFSNPAVITVWAVYIVSGGMFKTGVASILGKYILRLSGESEMRLIMVIMLICGIISAFINNVGATAIAATSGGKHFPSDQGAGVKITHSTIFLFITWGQNDPDRHARQHFGYQHRGRTGAAYLRLF